MFKKNWDIYGGTLFGLLMAVITKFQLETIQLCNSIVILILVSIGVLRLVKQEVGKSKDRKRGSIVDAVIDKQKPVKANSIAQNPTKDGEMLGKLLIKTWEVTKRFMQKLKVFFDKFKGIMLSLALGILSVVEMYGGFIGDLFEGKLTINGVDIVPIVALAASIVVGIISDGWTKEQRERIKALFSKSSKNELVLAEIKKTIKENTLKQSQLNKILSTKENELHNLQNEHEGLTNTLQAKKEMFAMTPQLATDEDVYIAKNAVAECEIKISNKKAEIDETKAAIDNLTTTIAALKSQI